MLLRVAQLTFRLSSTTCCCLFVCASPNRFKSRTIRPILQKRGMERDSNSFYDHLILYIISYYNNNELLKHLWYLVLLSLFFIYKNSIITFTGWEEERDENELCLRNSESQIDEVAFDTTRKRNRKYRGDIGGGTTSLGRFDSYRRRSSVDSNVYIAYRFVETPLAIEGQ